MDSKISAGSAPPYETNPSHPPPGPAGLVSPMHTGSYQNSPPSITHYDSYNQGIHPSHSPPPGTSPTQYPHQPIPPPSSNPPHYASQPPPGSPPPQISHAPPPAAMASPGHEKAEYYNAGTPGVGTHHPQQAGIPMQNNPGMAHPQQGQQQQHPQGGYGGPGAPPPAGLYHTVTPLQALNMAPAPVDCPVCHTRALTRVEQHSGNTTHAWAAVVCCVTGCGCIPYLIRGLKDTEHYCGHCGVLLATYHNSGHTVVHQFA